MLDSSARRSSPWPQAETGGRESARGAERGRAAVRSGPRGRARRLGGGGGGGALRGEPPDDLHLGGPVRGGRVGGPGGPVASAGELSSPARPGGRGGHL